MDTRIEIKPALPRKSSTSLMGSLLKDEKEKDEKIDSIPLEICSLRHKTYGSLEGKSQVKIYIWKPVYSKEIAKICCSETNISKSGHISMELFTSDNDASRIPYDEKKDNMGILVYTLFKNRNIFIDQKKKGLKMLKVITKIRS